MRNNISYIDNNLIPKLDKTKKNEKDIFDDYKKNLKIKNIQRD